MKSKNTWLDRNLTCCAYCYTLCLTEQDFHAEMKKLGIPVGQWPPFIAGAHSNATTHFIQPQDRDAVEYPVALVCIKSSQADPVVLAGLFVHEAVHIWQAHARHIGSFNDHGDEEEAYAIQWIAQQLMWSYVEQTK